MINVRNFCTIVFCTVCFTACNKPPEADDCFIAAILQERIHKDVQWARDCYAHESIDYTVQCLIDEPLTADSAVQIALLKNPNIQAAFEEIGIAQADLVEAGLLSNPIFEAIVRYPDKSGFNTNPEFSLTQNFIDILLMPLRVKVATAEFEKIKLQVAHTILLIAFDVERVYYSLVAAQKRKELLNNIVDLSEIGNEIAQAQRKAGNINLLNMQLRTSEYLTRVAELGEASAEIIHQRERLNRLLGLSGSEICWSVSSSLPFIPDSEPCFESLEQLAFEERLDLQAAKWEVERLNRIFPTVQWWSFTKLYAGASSTREPSIGSPWTTGPAFAGEIPIFNYGQGTRKRLWAQFRQACDRLASMEIDAYADVREARDKLIVYREQALLYASKVLPNQQEMLNSTEQLYNTMTADIYELLDAKKNQMTAYLHYQTALKEYWMAKIDLNSAIGGVIKEEEP